MFLAAQRRASIAFATRAASTRSVRCPATMQRLTLIAVPARRGLATTSANNLVPAALRGLDYVGTVAFAASGTMVAGHAGMDILGCTMVGTITSLGGGTIRDLLLGRVPVFWFKEIEYLLLCVGTALAAFYAHDKLEGPVAEEALWWGDTLGIGAFSVVGAQAAASVGMGPLVVPICGMFTATCGGLVRDVLCRRPPKLLYSAAQDSPAAAGTLYAPAALSGAIAWGSMQARAEATDAEVQRIEQAVKKTAEQAVANGQLSAVNQTQIKAVVDSLSQQQETLKATDEKLAQLIQIMLQKQ